MANEGADRGVTPEEFLAVWRELRALDEEPGSVMRPLVEEFAAGRVRVLLGEAGEAAILLPVMGSVEEGWNWTGRRIVAETTRVRVEDGVIRGMLVTCHDPGVEPAFAEFCVEILRFLRNGRPAPAAFREALRSFRLLAAAAGGGRWDRERVAGLLGELLVLDELLSYGLRDPSVWKGPAGGEKDFVLPGSAIESKAGVGDGAARMVIHGVRQLERPAHGRLLIAFHAFRENPQGGIGIADVVARIDEIFGGDERWMAALADAGIDRDAAGERPWEKYRFDLTEVSWYEVRDDFPRIAPEVLQNARMVDAVSGVTYQIEVRRLEGFRIDEKTRRKLLAEAVERSAEGSR